MIKQFLSFKKAVFFVRSLNLNSQAEWYKYCKSIKRPKNIPVGPHNIYKNKGWKNWYNWLGTNNDKRKYKVNDDYFKKWSHNMAYVLGFWWTDGNTDGNTIFNISQHKKNKYILSQILKDMNSNYPIKSYKNGILYFNISSKTIVKDIMNMGGKPQKSLTIGFPKIPQKYLFDFIRGLWDGDGCIWYSKYHKSYRSNITSGSKTFIKQLHNILKKHIPELKGKIRMKFSPKGTIIHITPCKKDIYSYQLYFGTNDTRRLKDFLYKPPVDLKINKKYSKFLNAGQAKPNIKYLNFKRARHFVRQLNLKNSAEWFKYTQSGQKPNNIPTNIHRFYKNQFKGIKNWLGTRI